mgnify:FL=1
MSWYVAWMDRLEVEHPELFCLYDEIRTTQPRLFKQMMDEIWQVNNGVDYEVVKKQSETDQLELLL